MSMPDGPATASARLPPSAAWTWAGLGAAPSWPPAGRADSNIIETKKASTPAIIRTTSASASLCMDRKPVPPLHRSHAMERIRIGCSGWDYQHWRGLFYPAALPQRRWFEYYAGHFDTVEINNSFYRLPKAETFDKWRAQAPSGFCYAVKANRFLNPAKKLKDCAEPLARM